jgi:hypothetical protein
MTDETRPDPGCRPHARVTIPAAANGPIVLPVAVSRPAWHDPPRRLSCRTTPHAVTVPVGREDARTHCTVPRRRSWTRLHLLKTENLRPLAPASFRAQAAVGGSSHFMGPGRHASGSSSRVGSPFFFSFLMRLGSFFREREAGRVGERRGACVLPFVVVGGFQPSRLFRRRRVNRKEERKRMAPARSPLGAVAVAALVVAIFMAAAAHALAPAPTSDGAFPIFPSASRTPHCGPRTRVTLFGFSLDPAGRRIVGLLRRPPDAGRGLARTPTGLSALPSSLRRPHCGENIGFSLICLTWGTTSLKLCIRVEFPHRHHARSLG